MGGSWTLFSSGRFILPSMKPFILVCGGVLVLAGLAIADDYSNYYDAGEDDAEWEYDEDLDVDMEGRKASAKGKCVTKPNLNQQCLQNTPKTRTVLVGGILQRTTAPAARKVQTPCSAAGQCRNTATRSDKGCPGVCNNAYTLSGKGFPCQNDPTSLKCAWCTMTGFQCYPDKWNGPDSKQGSRCQKQTNQKYCKSVQGDCRHIPGACPAERCVKVKDINKYMKYYECQCPDGYEGNASSVLIPQLGSSWSS